MTRDEFLEKLEALPGQINALPWWQQNLLEESKSDTSLNPRTNASTEHSSVAGTDEGPATGPAETRTTRIDHFQKSSPTDLPIRTLQSDQTVSSE